MGMPSTLQPRNIGIIADIERAADVRDRLGDQQPGQYVDVRRSENDAGGPVSTLDEGGERPGRAAGSAYPWQDQQLSGNAFAVLRVMPVDDAPAIDIDPAPEADGFIQPQDRCRDFAGNGRFKTVLHDSGDPGSRKTDPRTALSTQSRRLARQTFVSSSPGA